MLLYITSLDKGQVFCVAPGFHSKSRVILFLILPIIGNWELKTNYYIISFFHSFFFFVFKRHVLRNILVKRIEKACTNHQAECYIRWKISLNWSETLTLKWITESFESMSLNHSRGNTLDNLSATVNTFPGEANRRQSSEAISCKLNDRGPCFSLRFSFNLFGLLMTGYQIPISLSCSLLPL